MNRLRLLLLFFLLLVGSTDLWANANGSEAIDFRSFEQEKMDDIKDQSPYDSYGFAPMGLWDQFKEWLVAQLKYLFKDIPEKQLSAILSVIIKVIIWGIGLFAVFMVFFSLFKFGAFSFHKKEVKLVDIEYKNLEDQVVETNWQALIDIEINTERFNIALRLLFLQTIQLLNEKQLIVWEKNKTNFDYLRELRKTSNDGSFMNLIKYYNFGWFGDFEIKALDFSEIHSEFKAFNSSIS